jgi:type II secretory pathway pseudopilin PulG
MSDLKKEEMNPQIAQMGADSEDNLRQSAKSADQSYSRRIGWIFVECVLIVLILGLIAATVLPVIVGRSEKADRNDAQRSARVRPPPTSR